MAKVIARINKKTGNLELEVAGVKGESCKDITSFLSQHLDIYEEKETDEMYEVEVENEFIENM